MLHPRGKIEQIRERELGQNRRIVQNFQTRLPLWARSSSCKVTWVMADD